MGGTQAQAKKEETKITFEDATIQPSKDAARLFIKPEMQIDGKEVKVRIGLKDKKSVLTLTFSANTTDVEKIVNAMKKEGVAKEVWNKTRKEGYRFSEVGLKEAIEASANSISYKKGGKPTQEMEFGPTEVIIGRQPIHIMSYEEIATLHKEVMQEEAKKKVPQKEEAKKKVSEAFSKDAEEFIEKMKAKDTLIDFGSLELMTGEKFQKIREKIIGKINRGEALTEEEMKTADFIIRSSIMTELNKMGASLEGERFNEVYKVVKDKVKQLNYDEKLEIIRNPDALKEVAREVYDELH